jgi:hypothetical protein
MKFLLLGCRRRIGHRPDGPRPAQGGNQNPGLLPGSQGAQGGANS